MGWKTYDQQFRLRKAIDPSKKWDSVDDELWLLYMNQTVSGGIYHNRQSTRGQQFGNPSPLGQAGGKCYDFNNRGYCTRNISTYVHTCIKCNQAHPALSCQSNVGQGMSQRVSTFSRPRTSGSVNQSWGPMNTQFKQGHNFPHFASHFQSHPKQDIWELIKSPINLHQIKQIAYLYPNKKVAIELIEGFQEGFKLNFQGPRISIQAKNWFFYRKTDIKFTS